MSWSNACDHGIYSEEQWKQEQQWKREAEEKKERARRDRYFYECTGRWPYQTEETNYNTKKYTNSNKYHCEEYRKNIYEHREEDRKNTYEYRYNHGLLTEDDFVYFGRFKTGHKIKNGKQNYLNYRRRYEAYLMYCKMHNSNIDFPTFEVLYYMSI